MTFNILTSVILTATDLTLWNRSDPSYHKIHADRNSTNDIKDLMVICSMITEDNGEYLADTC